MKDGDGLLSHESRNWMFWVSTIQGPAGAKTELKLEQNCCCLPARSGFDPWS